MIFNTAIIGNIEQNNYNLYNKILTIKKTGSILVNGKRLFIKLKITSNVTSLWDSKAKKEIFVDISHFTFEDDITDTRNTHINVSDKSDIKVVFKEDDDYIYMYCQCNELTYGHNLIVNVMECTGDIKRVDFNFNAGFETLPNLNDLQFNISGNYEYELNVGVPDYTLKTKIMSMQIPRDKRDSFTFDLIVKANTPNEMVHHKSNILISSYENSSSYKFVEGTKNLYIQETKTDKARHFDFYTDAFASGVPTLLKLENCKGLKNDYVHIVLNNTFEDVDVSTFKKSTPSSLSIGTVKKSKTGNYKSPTGFMLQWGEVYFDGSTKKITTSFDTPFLECYNVQLTGVWGSDNTTTFVLADKTNKDFKIHLNTQAPITIGYLALGIV